ncbi:MAG: 50S ribosomal protein L6 [Anaerolineae bacterium]|nr:50S ribosomal protein L6 [Anaerolineae bacterium]
MSRVGRLPIPLPKGVKATINGSTVTVEGPKGKLERTFHPEITVTQEGGELSVTRPTDQRQHRSLHGLTRALLNNMVTGVSAGFERVLEIEGVGYRAEMAGNALLMHLGYSHNIEVPPPTPETSFEVQERGRVIIVRGIDKEVVGQTAAEIRGLRPPEPYKGKGVRYRGEIIRRKAGKAGKA